MEFIAASILCDAAVTVLAAWLVTARWRIASRSHQIFLSAAAFPALAALLFVAALLVALMDGSRLQEPGGGTGMVIFALVFFLFYAVAVGAIVGPPIAFAAVSWFRGRE